LAKRLLYVITKAERGGAQSHVLELLRAATPHFDVQLATEDHGYLVDEARALGISVVPLRHLVMPLNPLEDLRAVRELSRAIRSFRPDLIHAHSSKAGLLSRIAAKVNRVPCVFTAHGWGFSEGVPGARKLIVLASEWFAGKLGGMTIAVSEFDRRLALRCHINPPNRIVTILNGIADDDVRASPGQDAAVPVITMVARFSPQKDQATLLEALRTVSLPFQLWLVGDGPLLDQMRALTVQLGLADRVSFHGNSSSVPRILQQTHIFALISRYEGLPISILEAMRAGLPVVATDTGGVSEAVRHGWNGLLSPRRDPVALRANLERLLGDSQLRAVCGRNARSAYESRFLPGPMISETFRVYENLLA
jgi:glycosyltransferase involved in cell wall biosynthesis